MTVIELRDALNAMIDQGHGTRTVAIVGSQYSEGARGHEEVGAINLSACSPLYPSDKPHMTDRVVELSV